ncbi:MAG: excinuclease ABC subunit C [Gammaproteobacteria bacterium RBG_16_51_14]|nr:MAG: excinuclease ABC subunit C [Gammaproteobacteria bacterium RBG_16_51_14]
MPDKSAFNARAYLKSLTSRPGVYRMLDATETVIYVGKARNLKKRVGSYFTRGGQHSPKTSAMLKQVSDIRVTVTHTENEALILENNLIKDLKPRYNIWFRDDKSYPYIYLSSDQKYPRLSYHRGARLGKGRYFGPYPGSGAVRMSLNLIQKLFLVRSCEDSFFSNRSRPCLQYQIKRCSAPCVGLIEQESYLQDIKYAALFLEGKNEKVIQALIEPMQQAADSLEYERAARYRDQISSLRKVQEHQYINTSGGNIDIIGCGSTDGLTCVQVFFVRGGLNFGSKSYFPKQPGGLEAAAVLDAFLAQYYLNTNVERDIPSEILVSHEPHDRVLLQAVLSEQAGRTVVIKSRVRGDRVKWVTMVMENVEVTLRQRLATRETQQIRLDDLCERLKLEDPVERLECFDVSHIQGDATVASCVVFNAEGPVNSDYRHFNIRDTGQGDDYAAMRQVILRRYTRLRKEGTRLPDIILIDGGKGQVAMAREVLEELQLTDIPLLGIAKGPSRKPGLETLIMADTRRTIKLPSDAPALHLIQHIRDEAHRFAISGHRQRRKMNRKQSPLEQIEGIGNKRRRNLIHHFGGIQGIVSAGVDDLAMVPGINKNLARKIYNKFHT